MKEGDLVKIIGCREGGHKIGLIGKIKKVNSITASGELCHDVEIDGCTYFHRVSDLELLEAKKSIMQNIKTFVKNSLLSKEEKLMRKHGFKTECGEYTQDAKDHSINKLCKADEAEYTKIAIEMEAEEVAKKN